MDVLDELQNACRAPVACYPADARHEDWIRGMTVSMGQIAVGKPNEQRTAALFLAAQCVNRIKALDAEAEKEAGFRPGEIWEHKENGPTTITQVRPLAVLGTSPEAKHMEPGQEYIVDPICLVRRLSR